MNKVHLERKVLLHLIAQPLKLEAGEDVLDNFQQHAGGLHIDVGKVFQVGVHELDSAASASLVSGFVHLSKGRDAQRLGVKL